MKYFSQKSYPKVQLGGCKGETIAKSGCFLCSFTNLLALLEYAYIDPVSFNEFAFKQGGCLANASVWAKTFLMDYKKVTTLQGLKTPRYMIAETDHYKKYGVSQHFFVYDRETKKRLDPLDLDPQFEKNDYNIVSYRIFYPIQTKSPVSKELPKETIQTVEPTPIVQAPTIAPETVSETISTSDTIKPIHVVQDFNFAPKKEITLTEKFIDWLLSFLKK